MTLYGVVLHKYCSDVGCCQAHTGTDYLSFHIYDGGSLIYMMYACIVASSTRALQSNPQHRYFYVKLWLLITADKWMTTCTCMSNLFFISLKKLLTTSWCKGTMKLNPLSKDASLAVHNKFKPQLSDNELSWGHICLVPMLCGCHALHTVCLYLCVFITDITLPWRH